MVWSFTTLRPYLEGENFTVYTDNAFLRWLLSIPNPSRRLTRRSLRLFEFDHVIRCEKKKGNNDGEAVSQLATLRKTTVDIDDEIPCLMADSSASTLEPQHEVDVKELPETDMSIATKDTTASDQLERISLDELLKEQHIDAFYRSLRSRLNWKEGLPSHLDDQGILFRSVEATDQMVVSHILKAEYCILRTIRSYAGIQEAQSYIYR